MLTERLIRRLVAERRIAFTYSGRRVIVAEADIEGYHEAIAKSRSTRFERDVAGGLSGELPYAASVA